MPCIAHRHYGEQTLGVKVVGILYTNVPPAGIFLKLLPWCMVIHTHKYPVAIGITEDLVYIRSKPKW